MIGTLLMITDTSSNKRIYLEVYSRKARGIDDLANEIARDSTVRAVEHFYNDKNMKEGTMMYRTPDGFDCDLNWKPDSI